MSLHRRVCLFVLFTAATSHFVLAAEPNEFFAQSTVLAPGVLSVNDNLTPGDIFYPDTLLGIRSAFGFITATNDNGGPYAAEGGSGLSQVSVNNNGTISFVISGFPDFSFDGSHDQFGDYQVYVDVYDQFGFLEDTYDFIDSLQPGVVNQYMIPGINTNYDYNVYIDNTLGGLSGGDVDFFTFTGLTPGVAFSAETMQLGLDSIDTFLGWFDDGGNLIETDDDSGINLLSLIEGVVPASGKLTFAVTGYGDNSFLGAHLEDANYKLQLTVASGNTPGDFDNDGDVDGRDFLIWQRGGSTNGLLNAGDLADWQEYYGFPFDETLQSLQTVPEPGAMAWLVCVVGLGVLNHRGLSIQRSRGRYQRPEQ